MSLYGIYPQNNMTMMSNLQELVINSTVIKCKYIELIVKYSPQLKLLFMNSILQPMNETLYLKSSSLQQIDISFNQYLSTVYIDCNELKILQCRNLHNLTNFYVRSMELNKLDCSGLDKMESLRLLCPKLVKLNLSGTIKLGKTQYFHVDWIRIFCDRHIKGLPEETFIASSTTTSVSCMQFHHLLNHCPLITSKLREIDDYMRGSGIYEDYCDYLQRMELQTKEIKDNRRRTASM